jgi:hypothetical protein
MQGWWPHLLGHRRWRAGSIPIAVVLLKSREYQVLQIFYRSFSYIFMIFRYFHQLFPPIFPYFHVCWDLGTLKSMNPWNIMVHYGPQISKFLQNWSKKLIQNWCGPVRFFWATSCEVCTLNPCPVDCTMGGPVSASPRSLPLPRGWRRRGCVATRGLDPVGHLLHHLWARLEKNLFK